MDSLKLKVYLKFKIHEILVIPRETKSVMVFFPRELRGPNFYVLKLQSVSTLQQKEYLRYINSKKSNTV